MNRILKSMGYGLAIVLVLSLLLIFIHLAGTYGRLMFVAHYLPWRDHIADLVVFRAQTSVLDNTAAFSNDKTCAVPGNRSVTVPARTYAKVISRSACSCSGLGFNPGQWVQVKITSGINRGQIVWTCDEAVGAPL